MKKYDTKLIKKVVLNHIKKMMVPYIIASAGISILEIYMIIRGLLSFDLTNLRHMVYFDGYIVLLVSSLTVLTLLLINFFKKQCKQYLVATLYTYVLIIISWSGSVSFLDMIKGNTLIVFLTVIMTASALVIIRPIVYAVSVLANAIALIILTIIYKSDLVTSSGYLFNYFVFVGFSIFIAYKQYFQGVKEYLQVEELKILSYHDTLTGLFNRQALNDHISKIKDVFYFGIIDVDGFKKINDTYGHAIGDECLKKIALELKNKFGNNVYRFGGDEFTIITYKRSYEIEDSFNEINEIIADYMNVDLHITGGFYQPQSSEDNFDTCYREADKLLYIAKEKGKKRIEIAK